LSAAIVVLHDVTPRFEHALEPLELMLNNLEIKYSHAVIPFYHGQSEYDLENNQVFVSKLKSTATEIVMHGYYHKGKFTQNEFGSISTEHATELLELGLRKFKKVGLDSFGFIPPMWRISNQALDALKAKGFPFTETVRQILDLSNSRVIRSFVLDYDIGNPILNRSMVAFNKFLFGRQLKKKSLVRIALHPVDPPSAVKQAKKFLSQLKAVQYRFYSYRELRQELDCWK
jgi:predicted deacetylase